MKVEPLNRFPINKIMLITHSGTDVFDIVFAALSNGVGMVQLRDKEATDDDMMQLARRLKALTDSFQVPLIINDRLNVACRLGLGLHVGQNDTHPREARRRLGPNPLLGLTTHLRIEQIQQVSEWVDYIGCGPVYPTRTKLDAKDTIGLAGLKSVCDASALPVVGIGGISHQNVLPVWKAGASGVAVCGAICHASDPGAATQAIVEARFGVL